jgi:SSS family solute:Na+ symporter
MVLATVDWAVIFGYLALILGIALWVSRHAGKSSSDFFLSGRTMPWWLLGFSMVATTFSTDTPNLVTDIVRQNGVAGNWVWWAFLLTGMLTVFVYARLWRRSEVMTDVEFYEIRYSGGIATFLRGFRALYLGVFFNVMVMATATLAAIKIGSVMFQWSALQTTTVALAVTVVFSTAGGLTGVLLTDALLFVVAIGGSVIAAVVAVNHTEVGGLSQLMEHPNVVGKLDLWPAFDDPAVFVPLFLVPIAVQWWAAWYPGAEPGGGGYLAQRMLAAKNERHATGATLFFNVAHYALRPWPWILVALASLVVFPDLESLAAAFPHVDPSVLGHDLAYPAMLTFLPAGLLGLVVASLAAAYMSTISTHLNWGSSYIVNDFYKRFVKPEAEERELVLVGRLSTIALTLLAAALALQLQNALQAFQIILQIGAGTGLLFILRWFWWRINAWSELTAMVVSFVVALVFFGRVRYGADPLPDWQMLLIGVAITTFSWVLVTFLTSPSDDETLRSFYRRTQPGGPGWRVVRERAAAAGEPIVGDGEPWAVPRGILAMLAGCVAVYSALFATGFWLYGRTGLALALTALSAVTAAALVKSWESITGTAD